MSCTIVRSAAERSRQITARSRSNSAQTRACSAASRSAKSRSLTACVAIERSKAARLLAIVFTTLFECGGNHRPFRRRDERSSEKRILDVVARLAWLEPKLARHFTDRRLHAARGD